MISQKELGAMLKLLNAGQIAVGLAVELLEETLTSETADKFVRSVLQTRRFMGPIKKATRQRLKSAVDLNVFLEVTIDAKAPKCTVELLDVVGLHWTEQLIALIRFLESSENVHDDRTRVRTKILLREAGYLAEDKPMYFAEQCPIEAFYVQYSSPVDHEHKYESELEHQPEHEDQCNRDCIYCTPGLLETVMGCEPRVSMESMLDDERKSAYFEEVLSCPYCDSEIEWRYATDQAMLKLVPRR